MINDDENVENSKNEGESVFFENSEKQRLNQQMKLMESEIETFKNRKEPANNKNIKLLKEQFSNFNRRSDDFLERMEKMKGQFSKFSEDFGILRKIKEEKNREEAVFSTSTTNNSQDINMKIQFFIENILYFQKEMTDNNRILTEYVLYFEGVERKLEEYEKSLEKTKILPENVDLDNVFLKIHLKFVRLKKF